MSSAEFDKTDVPVLDSGTERQHPYRETPHGLVYDKPTGDGTVEVPLCNFTARIVAEGVRSDQRRWYQMVARLNGREITFEVRAAEFEAMVWVSRHLGAGAVVESGRSTRQHVRAAIQHLSQPLATHAHTGWHENDDQAVYLHGGGAIGASGPVAGIRASLDGRLARFTLPDLPDDDELRDAVRASLAVLGVASGPVSTALLAMVYRAPLGRIDFSGFLLGPSGTGKSELAALAQRHYGTTMDRANLPANWSLTASALEAIAHHVKDALLVIDDFAPEDTASHGQHVQLTAARLLRGGPGRVRMRGDTALAPSQPPRALLLSTGTALPEGASLRARLLVLEVRRRDVKWDDLAFLQELAARGKFATAMAGYLRWLAATGGHEAERVHALHERFRPFDLRGADRRAAHMVGSLSVGLYCFLQYAEDIGAVSEGRRHQVWSTYSMFLRDLGPAQAAHRVGGSAG